MSVGEWGQNGAMIPKEDTLPGAKCGIERNGDRKHAGCLCRRNPGQEKQNMVTEWRDCDKENMCMTLNEIIQECMTESSIRVC